MAEKFEAEIAITTDQAVREINALQDELRGLERSTEGATEGIEDFGGAAESSGSKVNTTANVISAAVQVLQFLKENALDAAKAMLEFGQEVEARARVMRGFSSDVSGASERLNGLLPAFTLIQQQSRLAMAGVSLTSQEFGNLSVAAQSFATATGQQVEPAFENLVTALIQGEANAFRPLGITMDGITDKAEVQREALRQLEARFGDASAEIVDFSGVVEATQNRIDDFVTSIASAVTESSALRRSASDLNEALGGLDATIRGADENAGALQLAFTAIGFAADNVTQQINGLNVALRMFESLNPAVTGALALLSPNTTAPAIVDARPSGAGGAAGMVGFNSRALSGGASGSATAGAVSSGGGGGGGGDGRSLEDLELERQKIDLIAEETKAQEELNIAIEKYAEVYRTGIDASLEAHTESIELRAAAEQSLYEKQTELFEQEKEDARAKEEFKKSLVLDTANVAIDSAAGIVQGIIGASAIERKEFLKKMSIQNTIAGLTELAKALAAQATTWGIPNPASIMHLAAAGQHFAVAAATGIGSAAIKTGGGGGGGGGSQEARPVGSGGGGNGSERSGTVVINFNSPMDEAAQGRAQMQASRAFERSYSGVIS